LAQHGLIHQALARAVRAEKLATLALLFILLTATTLGLSSVLASLDWALLWKSLLLGLLTGWLLGIFRQPPWRSACIVVAFGLIYTLLFTVGLGDKVIAVVAEFIRLAIQAINAIFYIGDHLDSSNLVHSFQDLITSTGVVFDRVRVWVAALIASQPTFDPVAAALVWSILIWFVAAWAGWVVECRRNALLATLPVILLGIAVLSYGRRVSASIYWMLATVLMLLATVQHDQREQGWDQTGMAYPARKGRQIGTAAIGITAVLVLLAALISSLSLQPIAGWVPVQRLPEVPKDDGLAKSLGIITANTAPAGFSTEVRRPGLPRDLLIGSGPELSEQIVMTVAVKDLLSISQAGQPLPLYWRSYTYDIYTGQGWRTSATQQSDYQANQPLQADHAPSHTQVQQVVRFVNGGDGSLYAAGIPVVINIPSHVARRSSDDLFGIRIDKIDSYTIQSLIPRVAEAILRTASLKYPDWIRQRYMALPPEVPGRVKQLAIELTASEPTAYDRGRAIERYLRKIPYTLDVSRPPSDRDLVDFFLFDLRKGYCDYYASAMVVLARAAGIPARLAIGYASGTYNLNSGRFVVSEADAHSWVEIYFPEVGWLPFEPTAARPLLQNSQKFAPLEPSLSLPAESAASVGSPKSMPWVWLLLLGVLLVAGVLVATWVIFDSIRLRRLSRPLAAVIIYRRMRRYGALLAVILEPGDTPYEFAATLNSRLQELTRQGIGTTFGLGMVPEIQALTDAIVCSSYRPSDFEVVQDSPILQLWRSLLWRLRLMWILKGCRALLKRIRGRLSGVTTLFNLEVEQKE